MEMAIISIVNIKVTAIVKGGYFNRANINPLIKNMRTDNIILKDSILFMNLYTNSFRFAISRVMYVVMPKSTNIINRPEKEIANETIPYWDTPKYLAIRIVHKNAQTLFTTCDMDNQLVFIKMDLI